jgi:hypothetical protein
VSRVRVGSLPERESGRLGRERLDVVLQFPALIASSSGCCRRHYAISHVRRSHYGPKSNSFFVTFLLPPIADFVIEAGNLRRKPWLGKSEYR